MKNLDECKTLEELCEFMNGLSIEEFEAQGIDVCDLPTFGGDEPDDTTGIWSWDEADIMVSWGDGEFIIDSRRD